MISAARMFDPFNTLDTWKYFHNLSMRWPIFLNALFESGKNHVLYSKNDRPPTLIFDYEVILEGRSLENPVNYNLVRILDRREGGDSRLLPIQENRQMANEPEQEVVDKVGEKNTPIIVVDPRAGHGPGIGGSKINSMIGIALEYGHPVYFLTFGVDPFPGQTIPDIKNAFIAFFEKVHSLHPNCKKPAVIGNCQAGWSVAMANAKEPGSVGPMILNGAPITPSSGKINSSSLRVRGALLGGRWLPAYLSDISGNLFDGAYLVSNFESLNVANTLCTKIYRLFANANTEDTRYVDFDKWWGIFCQMTKEEIDWILQEHFLEDNLGRDSLLIDGKKLSLKNIVDPIVVFCSEGDNITPVPQALSWIYKLYESVDEIIQRDQTIVYMVHPTIGHLGIFVASKICGREHQELIGSLDLIDNLPPGLYRMSINDYEGQEENVVLDAATGKPLYCMEIRKSSFDEVIGLCGGSDERDQESYQKFVEYSNFLYAIYQYTLSPYFKAIGQTPFANIIPHCHPLRVQRYLLSSMLPMSPILSTWARWAKKNYLPATDTHLFKKEMGAVKLIEDCLRITGEVGDETMNNIFKSIYI